MLQGCWTEFPSCSFVQPVLLPKDSSPGGPMSGPVPAGSVLGKLVLDTVLFKAEDKVLFPSRHSSPGPFS